MKAASEANVVIGLSVRRSDLFSRQFELSAAACGERSSFLLLL